MNLAEVIEEINTIIRQQTRAKNQTFDIFVSNLTCEHLLGDKLRINQVLINLLSNAVKYTPKNGSIQLRVDELPPVISNYSRICFTVSDNGLGMSEDYLKVIFDPFTREETKVTHEIQGTGLGMAITKSLVELMGGSIHVESEINRGSTFKEAIRRVMGSKKKVEDNEYNVLEGKKILVVDDIEVNRIILTKIIETQNASYDIACNGRLCRHQNDSKQRTPFIQNSANHCYDCERLCG